MKLRYKFNLLSLSVLLAVGTAISIAGVFTIERLAYSMNRKLMESEVLHVVEHMDNVHKVLRESGVTSVDSYVRKAQADVLKEFQDYRYGRTGRLLIFGEPGSSQLLSQLLENSGLDDRCLAEVLEAGQGFSECVHGKEKLHFYFARFPVWNWVVLLSVENAEMLEERNAFLNQVVLILLMGLVFGLLAFVWFSSNIVAPVQQLSQAALAISQGDWDKTLPEATTVDEVGDLARAFGQMSEHLSVAQRDLEKQAKALQNTNTRLHLEISEHQQAQQDIHQLNLDLERRVLERTAQLKAANEELEAFSYSVSHDLRAPLRSIDGFSQALLDDYSERLDDEGREFLQRVRRASQRMAQLIDDLLTLSRLTRSDMVRAPVDMSRLAALVSENLHLIEPQRQVEVVIQPQVQAVGDARLLRVVLENLLGNAWKFTSRCNCARIEFGRCAKIPPGQGERFDKPVFFVRDNGAGFDPAYAEKLFGVFQRLHRADEFPGTGIGLATVQRIVHRHGGLVWADGQVGSGATFYFSL